MKKSKNRKSMMVLGGAGQIGKPLIDFLKSQNVKVYDVDLVYGDEHDLRNDCSLADYWMSEVDFVFFLAYDIGGSKFLKNKERNLQFLSNNTSIMNNVFKMLSKHKKPFIFASSAMSEMPWSPYGNLKKLGEHFTESIGGISARFWNVYGPEHDDLKAHVITDFIKKAKNTGTIEMLTDGTEVRQMLYTDDCSKALFALADNFEEAKTYRKFDVTNGIWSSIYEIAQVIAEHYEATIVRPDTKDIVQFDSKIEPNLKPISNFWKPESAVSLKEGIYRMIEYYEEHE